MSSGRKANDGNVARRYPGVTKWGNTVDSESSTGKHEATKRANRNYEKIDSIAVFEDENLDKDRYLITYADLITLLLGLFIILYAMSNIDSAKYKEIVGAMGSVFGSSGEIIALENANLNTSLNPIQLLKGEINSLVGELDYDDFITVEEDERGVIIRIQEDILFESGDADIDNDSKAVLFSIANIIRNIPNDIRIEGNTDNVPINTAKFPTNWHLSSARAINTVVYFIQECGLDPQKLSIVGNADFNPISSNENVEGRAKNRRVDIVIIK